MQNHNIRSVNRPSQRTAVLAIAGSDSGGGAGIQADLRTFAAFGVHGTCAITAVTAQNTREVTSIFDLPAAVLRSQIDAVLADFPIGAIKIGMLGSAHLVRAVAEALESCQNMPVVLDPVLVATTGAALARAGLAAALSTRLLSRADLLTPNIPEAEQLLDRRISTRTAMREAATVLIERGARAVLLKGGHLRGSEVSDLLLTPEAEHWFHGRRLRGESHGTGCTLSSAVAAGLALGAPLETAVGNAIEFVRASLAAGYRPGRGALRVLDPFAAQD